MFIMAMHITCHSNDCLPNQFPPPRPTQRDYGNVMLSDYEKGHVMYQSIPTIRTDVEGGTTFPDDDDIDLIALHRRQAPTAEQRQNLDTLLDPILCVTPEKAIKERNVPKRSMTQNTVTSCLKDSSKDLKNTRVRFDQQVTVQHLSPEQNDDSSIIDIDRTADMEREIIFDDETQFSDESSGSDADYSDTEPKTYTFSSVGTDKDSITNIITQTDELNLSSDMELNIDTIETQNKDVNVVSPVLRKIARPSKKRQKYKPDISESDVIDVKPQKMASSKTLLMGSGTAEHALARPEFNSTLFMSKEVQELSKKEIDLPAAVSEVLKVEKNRAKIQEKASLRLNHDGTQFPSLVSVEVNEDDLLEAVEKKMGAKVKPSHKPKQQRPEDLIRRPPDIMDFFSPDLQREVPSFSLHNIPPPVAGLTQADPLSAFSVYQQVRAWEDW